MFAELVSYYSYRIGPFLSKVGNNFRFPWSLVLSQVSPSNCVPRTTDIEQRNIFSCKLIFWKPERKGYRTAVCDRAVVPHVTRHFSLIKGHLHSNLAQNLSRLPRFGCSSLTENLVFMRETRSQARRHNAPLRLPNRRTF